MEDNFFVGVVYHGKRVFKPEYKEKIILYTDDNINFLDLIGNCYYTTDRSNRNYVDENSLIPTDISLYREDYLYLLSKHKQRKNIRKRII